METPLRIFYAAGPGDVAGTYLKWKEGADDPSQVSVTYSAQFFDVCRKVGARAYVTAHCKRPARVSDEQFTIEHRAKPFPGATGLFYHLAEMLHGLRVVMAALRFRADVAIINEGTTHWFVLSSLSILGVKVIPAIHCVLWPKFGDMGRRQRLMNRVNRRFFQDRASAILSASDDISQQVVEVAEGQSLPIVPFLPTYRKETFANIPPPPVERDPFRVFFAGRIEVNKGVFDLLAIARRFKTAGRENIRFDLCGSGWALDRLSQEADAAGLADSFRCHGHRNRHEIQELLGQSHIVIVPTTTQFIEGFNQVVVEAVLAGRPVITSAVCPALALVREAVLEVAPDDVEGYGDAILRLADDGWAYEKRRRACGSYQAQFYDLDQSWGAALSRSLRGLCGALPDFGATAEPPELASGLWTRGK